MTMPRTPGKLMMMPRTRTYLAELVILDHYEKPLWVYKWSRDTIEDCEALVLAELEDCIAEVESAYSVVIRKEYARMSHMDILDFLLNDHTVAFLVVGESFYVAVFKRVKEEQS
jgi:hypothetical protein